MKEGFPQEPTDADNNGRWRDELAAQSQQAEKYVSRAALQAEAAMFDMMLP